MNDRCPHEELPDLSELQANELLSIHAGTCDDSEDERMHSGFIFTLYSWNDGLSLESFQQVMACIKALGPSWSSGPIPSRTIGDLWTIIYLGNIYLQNPGRIRQRTERGAAPEELSMEERWLDCVGFAVMTFLQFNDTREAFRCYDDCISEYRARKR